MKQTENRQGQATFITARAESAQSEIRLPVQKVTPSIKLPDDVEELETMLEKHFQ